VYDFISLQLHGFSVKVHIWYKSNYIKSHMHDFYILTNRYRPVLHFALLCVDGIYYLHTRCRERCCATTYAMFYTHKATTVNLFFVNG